jgi:hypothetical protein
MISPSQTGDVLTFSLPVTFFVNQPNNRLISVGDILDDVNSGTIYAVTAVTPGSPNYSFTAQQCNNFSLRSGSFVSNSAFVATGNFKFVKTTTRIPTQVYFGDFQAGYDVVRNVHGGDGNGASATLFTPTGMLISAPLKDPQLKSPIDLGTYIGTVTTSVNPDGTPGGSTAKLNLVYYNGSPHNAARTGRFPILPVEVDWGIPVATGLVVLSGGTATVNYPAVQNFTQIYLASQIDGGTPGWLRVSSRVPGVSFTITSSSNTDTSTIGWSIPEQCGA